MHSLVILFNYGSNLMSFFTVCRWVRIYSADIESVKSAPKSCRSKYASSPTIIFKKKNFSKIRHKIYISADCGHGWNFKSICIALLRNNLKMKNQSTWRAPHLLNEEQKCTHVRAARKLLKQFSRYDQKYL